MFGVDGRIRGHSQLQGEHEALEELLWELRYLLWKDLTDEGDQLVVLVTQGGELKQRDACINTVSCRS